MIEKKISKAVVARLPRYHRYLGELMNHGIERISSTELGKIMNLKASQIRQDLNYYGGFGQQGYGYHVASLYEEIGKILGLSRQHNMIIVGAGNLGQALTNYMSFEKNGFIIKGLFDVNPMMKELSVRGIKIRMMDEIEPFIKKEHIEIATLTLPKSRAEEVAQKLVNCGIKAIWNFAHIDLKLPSDVVVENVHLSDSLMTLSYRLQTTRPEPGEEVF